LPGTCKKFRTSSSEDASLFYRGIFAGKDQDFRASDAAPKAMRANADPIKRKLAGASPPAPVLGTPGVVLLFTVPLAEPVPFSIFDPLALFVPVALVPVFVLILV